MRYLLTAHYNYSQYDLPLIVSLITLLDRWILAPILAPFRDQGPLFALRCVSPLLPCCLLFVSLCLVLRLLPLPSPVAACDVRRAAREEQS